MSNFIDPSHLKTGSPVQSRSDNKTILYSANVDPDECKPKQVLCKISFQVEESFIPNKVNEGKKNDNKSDNAIRLKWTHKAINNSLRVLDKDKHNSTRYIDKTSCLVTKITIGSCHNNAYFPLDVTIPALEDAMYRHKSSGHPLLFTIPSGMIATMGTRDIYENPSIINDEKVARYAVLTPQVLNESWKTNEGRTVSQNRANVYANSLLYPIIKKNFQNGNKYEEDVDNEVIITSIDVMTELIKKITEKRKEDYNFCDTTELEIVIKRHDNLPFSSLTNTKYATVNGQKEYDGVLNYLCNYGFTIDIEFLAISLPKPKEEESELDQLLASPLRSIKK